MKDARYYEERQSVQEFLKHIGEDDGLATYGEQEILQAIKSQNLQLLIVSEEVRRNLYRLKCKVCGYVENRIVDNEKTSDFEANLANVKCLKCGGDVEVLEKEDLIEALAKLAESSKTPMKIISTNTEEGVMLLKSFGGIAGITKFRQF